MLNSIPVTPRYWKGAGAKATTAQTDQTGATATNIVTIYTAAATGIPGTSEGVGAQVYDLTIRVPVTSAAAVVVIFKKVGGVRFVIKTVSVPAITVSATVPGYDSGKLTITEMLNPGDTIDMLSTVTQETHGTVNVGEY